MTVFDEAATTLTNLFEAALTDNVEVWRRTGSGTDDFGESTATFQKLADVACWVSSGGVTEDRLDEESTFRTKTVLCAVTADIEDDDRIRYQGRDYHIVGVETIHAGSVPTRKRVSIEVAS